MQAENRPSKMSKRLATLRRRAGLGVSHRSRFANIYHCCVQRTASQWLRNIYNDEVFYRHTGLRVVPYIDVGLSNAHFDEPFPERTIVTHLYISHPTYLEIPKPAAHRSFFVQRDPRDAVVSWYFAARYSHKPIGVIPGMRRDLSAMSQEEGIHYTIDAIAKLGYFDALRSWAVAEPPVHIFRYEEIAEDHRRFLGDLFEFLEIPVRRDELESLADRKSFQRATGGRSQGEEDVHSHLRKGTPGDWRTALSDDALDHLHRVSGDLVSLLGYEP
jgi:hypothetical protein